MEEEIPLDESNNNVPTNHRVGFDPFKKADVLLAEKHRKARMIRKISNRMKDPDVEKCECCGFPVDADPFPLCCSLFELGEIGPGFPLYYTFIKLLGVVFFIGICVVSLPCIVNNVAADMGDAWQQGNDSWILKASVGNNGNSDAIFPQWQSILHIVYMILILFAYSIGKRVISKQELKIDVLTITPKDYTVHVYGLPLDTTEEQVKELFEKYGRHDKKPATVVKVNFPYKIREYVENLRQFEDIKENIKLLENLKILNKFQKNNCCKKIFTSEELKAKLKIIGADIKQFETELPSNVGRTLLIGQAFVTFETQAEARSVELKYAKHWLTRFWISVFTSLFSCCLKKSSQSKSTEGLFGKIAHEPSDIFWENLEISFSNRIRSTVKTYLITATAIFVSFAAVYGMKKLGEQQLSYYKDKTDLNTTDTWKIRVYSIWPSICIIIINFILGRLTRYFSSFERPHSITDYNTSVAIKLTYAMFFNTALITLIVNYDWKKDWFTSGGLIVDATYILFSNAFLSPLIYLFSPIILIRIMKKRKAAKAEYISQSDANQIFENPEVDMAQRYANAGKTILLTLLYTPILPSAILISSAGILFEYWISKYLLLRRHTWPKRLSGELSQIMLHVIPMSVLLYSIMNYVCMRYLNPSQSLPALIWMIIMFVVVFIPVDSFFVICLKNNSNLFENMYTNDCYENMAIGFLDDYDRVNPVTSNEGWKWLAEIMKKKCIGEEEKIEKIQKKIGEKNENLLKGMKNYAFAKKGLFNNKAINFGLNGMKGNLKSKRTGKYQRSINAMQSIVEMNYQETSKKYKGNSIVPLSIHQQQGRFERVGTKHYTVANHDEKDIELFDIKGQQSL